MSLELAAQPIASLVYTNIEAVRDIFRYANSEAFCAVLHTKNPWQRPNYTNLLKQVSAIINVNEFYNSICTKTVNTYQYLCRVLAKNQTLALAFASIYIEFTQEIEDFYKNQPIKVQQERKLKLEYLHHLPKKLMQALDNYVCHLEEESEWQGPRSEISAYSKKILEKKWQTIDHLKSTLLNQPESLIFKKLCRFLQEFPKHHENLKNHINREDTQITNIIASLVHLNIEVFKDIFRAANSENFCAVLRIKNSWQHSSYIIDSLKEISTLIDVNKFSNSICTNTVDVGELLACNENLALAFASICIKFTQEIEGFYKYQPIEVQQARNLKLKNSEQLLEKLLPVLDNYGDELAKESERQGPHRKTSADSKKILKEKWQAIIRLKSTLLDCPNPDLEGNLIFKKLCRFAQEFTQRHGTLRTHRNSVGTRIIKIFVEIIMNIISLGAFWGVKYKQQGNLCFWRSQGASTANKLCGIFKKVGDTDKIQKTRATFTM